MLDLDAIQTRADAAWAGPWALAYTATCPGRDSPSGCEDIGDCPHMVPVGIVAGAAGEKLDEEIICWDTDGLRDADADFIIRSRQDVPALVAELRVTRAVAEAADRVMHGAGVQSELRATLTAWHEHNGEAR